MAYREFGPSMHVADLVACTWERTVAEPGATRVVPDGCVDLVWRSGGLFVAGPDSRAFMSPVDPDETIVGLRFRTGRAGNVLGLPVSELRDTRVPLEEIWDAELAERLGEAPSADDRRALLEQAVVARTAEPDPLVLAAVGRLGHPGTRIGALSDALGTSERQLLRRFHAAVGYGPKTLDRVLRFQRFLARASEGDLARTAAELGYADQSHLTRECVRLSGVTPGQLAA
jgi:AraC-like DNA-binding protein